MSFFEGLNFFTYLIAALSGAAVLGILEKPLRHYAFLLSVLFYYCSILEQAAAVLISSDLCIAADRPCQRLSGHKEEIWKKGGNLPYIFGAFHCASLDQ